MARYRTYKNGITGHKYKGLYIVRGEEKGKFEIWNADKSVYQSGIYDFDDCEWIIDKLMANEEELATLKFLYQKEIFELSSLFVELMQEKEREGLAPYRKKLYDMVEKIRKRKVENRAF